MSDYEMDEIDTSGGARPMIFADAVPEINYGGSPSGPAMDHIGDPGDEWYNIELGKDTNASGLSSAGPGMKWLTGTASHKRDLVKASVAAVTRFLKVDSGEASTAHGGMAPPATTAVSDSRAKNVTQLLTNSNLSFLSSFFEAIKSCVSSCCGFRSKKAKPKFADPEPLPEFVINMNQTGSQVTTPQVSIFIPAMLDTIRRASLADPGMVQMAPVVRYGAMPTPTSTEPGPTPKAYAPPIGRPSHLKSRDLPAKETVAVENCTAKENHNTTLRALDKTPSLYHSPPVAAPPSSSAAAMFPAYSSTLTEAESFLYAAFSEQSDGSEYDPDSQTLDPFIVTLPAPTSPVTTSHNHTAHSFGTVIENNQSFSRTNGFANVENVILDTHQTTFEDVEVGTETHQLAQQIEEAIQEMTDDGNWMEDESTAEQSRTDNDDNRFSGESSVYGNIGTIPLAYRPFRYPPSSAVLDPWTEEQFAEYISTVARLESLCDFFDTAAAECDDDDEVTNTEQEHEPCLVAQNLLMLNTPVPEARVSAMFEDLLEPLESAEAEDRMGPEDLDNGDEGGDEQDEHEHEGHEEHEVTAPTATETNTTGSPAMEVTVSVVVEGNNAPAAGVEGGLS